MILEEFQNIFKCPDDGYPLIMKNKFFQCENCGLKFPILAENVVELLPSKPYPLNQADAKRYLTRYAHLFQDKFDWNPSAQAWGDLSIASKGFRAFVKKERKLVENYLGESLNGLLCDVSAGAGNYSLYFAKLANLVVHADLDVNAINYAYQQSKQYNIERIIFVRCDYLQMPFASDTFDSLICTSSTFGNGFSCDARLLSEMIRCLKLLGSFVADFPNKLRVPAVLARKVAIAQREAPYDYSTLQKFFSGIVDQKIIKPIGYVPLKLVPFEKAYAPLDKIFRMLRVPPSTYVVSGKKK